MKRYQQRKTHTYPVFPYLSKLRNKRDSRQTRPSTRLKERDCALGDSFPNESLHFLGHNSNAPLGTAAARWSQRL